MATCRNPDKAAALQALKDDPATKGALHIVKIDVADAASIRGAYDEVADSAVLPFFKAITKVKWYTFAQSSHTPHWEEREKYMKLVSDFFLKA